MSELLGISLAGSCLVVCIKMLVSPRDIVTVVLLPDTSASGNIISAKLSVLFSDTLLVISFENFVSFLAVEFRAN